MNYTMFQIFSIYRHWIDFRNDVYLSDFKIFKPSMTHSYKLPIAKKKKCQRRLDQGESNWKWFLFKIGVMLIIVLEIDP